MAKQPTTVEHYEIRCKAEIDQLGRIIAALTREGVTEIDHELVTKVRGFAHRKDYETTARDEVLKYTEQHPTFRLRDLGQHFRDLGRSVSAAHYAVGKLVDDGVLKKLDAGNYQLGNIKAIAPPQNKDRKVNDPTNAELIWRHVKNRKTFYVSEIKPLFVSNSRNVNSIPSQVAKLVKDKRLKGIGDGEYEVLKPKASPKKAAREVNGSGASVEASHG